MNILKTFLRWAGIAKPQSNKWWEKPTVAEQIAEERFPKEELPKILHWCPQDPMYPACGIHRLGPWTADPREATCKNCRNTSAWKLAFEEISND